MGSENDAAVPVVPVVCPRCGQNSLGVFHARTRKDDMMRCYNPDCDFDLPVSVAAHAGWVRHYHEPMEQIP